MATIFPLVSDVGPENVDWQNHLTNNEKSNIGMINVTLTELDSTVVPQVAEGSVIEINGSGAYWESDESISGVPSAGNLNYIEMVLGVPTWTTTPPTWIPSKGGWYIGNNRYLGGCYYDTDYLSKFVYNEAGDKVFQERLPLLFPLQDINNYLELSGGTKTQRIIYCKGLHVTATTLLEARMVIVDGDMIIDPLVNLTIRPMIIRKNDTITMPLTPGNEAFYADNYFPADSPNVNDGGAGVLGGGDGVNGGGADLASGGSGSISEVGGASGDGGKAGGVAYWPDLSIGGEGGAGAVDTGARRCGGGAGPGGAGGSWNASEFGAGGGEFCIFIVRGNFINPSGSITSNGDTGAGETNSGGGGGGMLIFFVYGETCNFGVLECIGGAGDYGGGGGGGHIHAAGHTSTFTGLDVSGGVGANSFNGASGTTTEIDLDATPSEALGGKDSDDYIGWLTKLIEGVLI